MQYIGVLYCLLYYRQAVVFCIHGNKWGVAECCEEWEGGAGEGEHLLGGGAEAGPREELNHCHQSRQQGVDKK